VNHEDAHQHIAATDPRIAALIARSPRYNIKPAPLIRPFDALAESIAYQQLSGKAAATIWIRKKFWRRPMKVFARLAFPAARLRQSRIWPRKRSTVLCHLLARSLE
jgi:DNA-3-methyladenine glycosylase II